MGTFITLITLIIFSGGGMVYLAWNRFRAAGTMEESELLFKLRESKSLFTDFHEYIVVPSVNFWKSVALPNVYKEFEKAISRFRINVLKIECWLLKLTNYIRGKRTIQNNNGDNCSPYWKDVKDYKNGENKPE